MDKLSPEIFNANENALAKLAALFPTAVKDGLLDVTALKEELGQFEEADAEKYELTWAGKQAAKKAAQSDVAGRTLKFIAEDSKNADTTENLYIEGDNLEVLKLLRQNYYGAVKMVYIDPPYNKGKDRIYRDTFAIPKVDSDEDEGETEDGERMVINQKSNNRYHANWLNMIYPRLRVARDLLRDDGIIFISIDDDELKNLLAVCEEIFGAENIAACIPWQSRLSMQNDTDLSVNHEYLVAFAKIRRQENRRLKESNAELWFNQNTFVFRPLPLDKSKFENPDNDPRGPWKADPFDAPNIRPNLTYPITNPVTGDQHLPPSGRHWRISPEKFSSALADGRIIFGKSGTGRPQMKSFYEEKKDFGSIDNSWFSGDKIGTATAATQELQAMFDNVSFDNPKPISLLNKLLTLGYTQNDDIILDFFSGSATTAHAVMQLNAEDGGNRKFIMVQYPEKTTNSDYPTICEIGKERIRRAGKSIYDYVRDTGVPPGGKKMTIHSPKDPEKLTEVTVTHDVTISGGVNYAHKKADKMDVGFKVFRVSDTNIRWTHEELKHGQVTVDESMLSDKEALDFMPDTNDIDIVYEILLRQRDIPLSAKVEKLDIGKRTYLFADAYAVCLDDDITKEMIEGLAAIEPTPIKYIMRDSAFGDNITHKDETMRRLDAYIARNSGEQKKTYTVEMI